MNNFFTDFFYYGSNINDKKNYTKMTMMKKNNEREEDVNKSSVEREWRLEGYFCVIIKEKKTWQYKKFSTVLFALDSKISWSILQDRASLILEDGRVELEFNENAGPTFFNRNIPNILRLRWS